MRSFSIFLLAVLSTGCSLDAEIIKAPEDSISLHQKINVVEGVATSHQYERTDKAGYLVQGSAGAGASKIYIRSNLRGYQIFQGIQGQVISEDPR